MASSKPKLPLSIRWAAIGLAVISFLWLPVEDTTVAFLLFVSTGWCTWGAVYLHFRIVQQKPSTLKLSTWIGGLSGLMVSPLALVLALLKAGVHAHGFLDFTTKQLGSIAGSTLIWMLLGILMGWLVFRLKHRTN